MSTKDIKHLEKIGQFNSTISLPGSKSITNRALALAAISSEPSKIFNPLVSDDVEAFVEALRSLGAELSWDQNEIAIIKPLADGVSGEVDCRDAGTCARFLPPIVAGLKSNVAFDASTQLKARPMSDLIEVLIVQGVRFDPQDTTHLPFNLQSNGLSGNEIEVPGNISSQFLSGILMSSPLADHPTTIRVKDLISKPYIDLTISMMAEYGVEVNRSGYELFEIENQGRYFAPKRGYSIEADASTASYFFGIAVASGSTITVSNIRKSSLQGDLRLLDIFEQMGADVKDDAHGITVTGPDQLVGVDVDMNDITDVMMTLACIAPLATSPTTIRNVEHARFKESDRIDAVVSGLTRLGVKVEYGNDWLKIYPSEISRSSVDTFEDHRIAMSFSVLGLATGKVDIENPDCVKKTCPNFYELVEDLN